MLENAHVFVVVPARNEAPRIGDVLRTMPAFVDQVLVVDDGSSDRTSDVARACGEGSDRITVIRHEESRGVGAAIVSGYRAALARSGGARDALAVMAGDGQMDPADLVSVVTPVVRGEAGYVKGNRFVSPDARAMPLGRRVAGEVLSVATSLAAGVRIRDSQCGFTALSREAASRIDLDAVWPRYGYPNDLIARLAAANVHIAEVTVRPIYRGEPSGVRPWHVARIGWLLARAAARRFNR